MKHEAKERQEWHLVRDDIAALLSVVPGLGHAYKGQWRTGLGLVLLAPLMVFAGILLSLSTAGLGLMLPVIYWLGCGFAAYHAEDVRKHHPLHL